jgi:hypothetical protein
MADGRLESGASCYSAVTFQQFPGSKMEDCCFEECLCIVRQAEIRCVNADMTASIMLNVSTEYAAAFFLLADHLKDAVNVCLNQLKDLQLAIAVARVYEGDESAVLREVIEEKVLPLAAAEGNRWLASWAFWMLHRRDMAVRALIVSCASIDAGYIG